MVKAWIWKLWRRLWRGSGGALEQELEELEEDLENDLEEAARVLIWRPEWESARVLIWRPHWGSGSQPGAQVQGIGNSQAKRPDTSRPLMGKPE